MSPILLFDMCSILLYIYTLILAEKMGRGGEKMPKRFISLSTSILLVLILFAFPAGAEERTILYNGVIYAMTDMRDTAEAVLIEGNRIIEIGDSADILALADENTNIIDLDGHAVFPGFLDPHTHMFNSQPNTWEIRDTRQASVLALGITTVSEMFNSVDNTQDLINYALSAPGRLRLRLNLYLNYNSSCGELLGHWYVNEYTPGQELVPRLRVGGVKIFSEISVCPFLPFSPVFSPSLLKHFTERGREVWGQNEVLFSQEELTDTISYLDALGYQVAIHAIGDLGIETCLQAINSAVQGLNHNRHIICHNYFIRNDMLDLYREADIIAQVEPPSPCHRNDYELYVGPANSRLYKRWHTLLKEGIHVTLGSDWPYVFSHNPMRKLYAVVTGENAMLIYPDDEICPPVNRRQAVTVWEGLRMMTTEAAYAMRLDDELGSIEIGKLADLVVLSEDPFEVKPEEIKDITVLMTIVNGVVEYRLEDF